MHGLVSKNIILNQVVEYTYIYFYFYEKQVIELHWSSVIGWLNQGGVKLGITRTIPDEEMMEKIAMQIKHLNISSCVIAGGTEV